MKSSKKSKALSLTLYILSLLDSVFTLYAINHGGIELNPIANLMIILHPLVYLFYKIVVVGLICWWLSSRIDSVAKWGLIVLTTVFACVDFHHLYFITGAFKLFM